MGWTQAVVPPPDVKTRAQSVSCPPRSARVNGMWHIFSFQIQAEVKGGSRALGLDGPLSSRFSVHMFGRAPRGGAVTAEPLSTKAPRRRFQKIPSLVSRDKWSPKFASEMGEARSGGSAQVQGIVLSQHETQATELCRSCVWPCAPSPFPRPA